MWQIWEHLVWTKRARMERKREIKKNKERARGTVRSLLEYLSSSLEGQVRPSLSWRVNCHASFSGFCTLSPMNTVSKKEKFQFWMARPESFQCLSTDSTWLRESIRSFVLELLDASWDNTLSNMSWPKQGGRPGISEYWKCLCCLDCPQL